MRRQDLGLLALIGAVVFAAYASGLRNGFVWLDHVEIQQKLFVVEDWRSLVSRFFADPQSDGYFRPWYTVAHSLDYALWGFNPTGFHLSSVVVHAVNVMLVFALGRALGVGVGRAAIVSLVWGLHPRLTASVGLIHARADLWCLCFLLIASCVLASGRGIHSSARVMTACVFVLLAGLSKEVAYLAPVAAAVWFGADGRLHRDSPSRPHALRALVALSATVVCLLVWRLAIASPGSVASGLSVAARVLNFGPVYLGYLFRTITVFDLSIADTTTRIGFLSATTRALVGMGLLTVSLLSLWAWRTIPRSRPWILLYHLALLPVAQILPILHFRADRFLYIPSLILIAALVMIVPDDLPLWRGRAWRWAVALVVCGVTIGSVAVIQRRLRDFRNDGTLFEPEIARQPRYLEGLGHLAIWNEATGKLKAAELLYRRALAPAPEVISFSQPDRMLLNLSRNLLAQQNYAASVRLAADFPGVVMTPVVRLHYRYNVAIALFKLGRPSEAVGAFADYAAARPEDADGQYWLGRAALDTGDLATGRAALRAYLHLNPLASDSAEVRALLK